MKRRRRYDWRPVLVVILNGVILSIIACTPVGDRVERENSEVTPPVDSPIQVGMRVDHAMQLLPTRHQKERYAILKGDNEFQSGEPYGGIVTAEGEQIGLVYDIDMTIIEIHPVFREYERRGFKFE